MRSLEEYQILEHIVLEQADLKICNVAGKEKVRPVSTKRSQMKGENLISILGKASWNVIRLRKIKE